MLQIGDPCPLCKGKKGQGKARRSPGVKKTEDTEFFGLTAEDVAEKFPEAVSWVTDEAGETKPDGIDYSALVALLVFHVQKLRSEVAALKG
jgi:hypothetical protein